MEFYKGWIRNPRKVGAIAPTSADMARKMASVIRPDSGLPVLELGPGTGAITKAILERGIDPGNLVCVEYTKSFLPGLRQRFPGVNFVHGDAFDISQIAKEQGIDRFDAVVSALPLLTTPVHLRVRLVEAMLDLLEPGRPMVQFSYMLGPPVPAGPGSYAVSHLTTVLQNLPPARLWTYQRPPDADGEIRHPCSPPDGG
jgi:phosphatidylethanolamine/phosphatidyl-N-methylethanolamine N-methyltransferase